MIDASGMEKKYTIQRGKKVLGSIRRKSAGTISIVEIIIIIIIKKNRKLWIGRPPYSHV